MESPSALTRENGCKGEVDAPFLEALKASLDGQPEQAAALPIAGGWNESSFEGPPNQTYSMIL